MVVPDAPLLHEEPLKESPMEAPLLIDQVDVLVFKRSPLETKIFTSVLSKMCERVESASSYKDFKHKIETARCTILVFDKEMLLDDTQSFLTWVESIAALHKMGKIHTIMFVDPKTKNQENDAAFDAILPNQISKQELETLIQRFRH